MRKRNQSLAQNKNFGHLVAFVFYIGLGYFLFIAASNMNYVWKWNSIPKYFAYEEVINVEAPIDGKFTLKDGKYFVIDENNNQEELIIDDSYKLDYEINEDVYEGDYIASKSETKPGPVLVGLWITLKISFLAGILTFAIGIPIAFMRLSNYGFLRDIAGVYVAVIRGTPLLVQIFLFYFIVANIF